jgi:hypothetical protein
MRTSTLVAFAILVGGPAVAAAHDEAKTPINSSIILEMTRPSTQSRERAFDESLKDGAPSAKPSAEPVVQPDGSVKYGNTTVIIRHDCPPGGEFYEPLPRPGRRR